MAQYRVQLDDDTAEMARALGDGRISKGINAALDQAPRARAFDGPRTTYHVTIRDDLIDLAIAIGDGNLSAGVRSAIRATR